MIKPPATSLTGHGLHRVRPETSLLLLATVLAAALAVESVLLKGVTLLLVLTLAVWSGGWARSGLRSLRFVAIFSLLLFLAQALSLREGTVLFRFGVSITDRGLLAGAHMALRFLAILSSSLLFALSTDPDALAHALIRWGIPYRHGYTVILALRFVPFFHSELKTVREAQQMRGVRTSARSFRSLQRAIRYTFIPVLVSGLLRVDTIAMSMKGRAFGLHDRRTPATAAGLAWEDGVVWVCSALLVGMTVLAGRSGWL